MNTLYGTVITAMIIDENDTQYFVQKNGMTFSMDKSEDSTLKVGDIVNGFVYESVQKKKRLTTILPTVQQGKYGWATVTQVRKDLGVFVDIGLKDKEIVISLDDLPQLKTLWPKKNDRLLISLTVDKKDRIWGQLANESVFRSISRRGRETQKNNNVVATVFRLKIVGTYVLTDDYYIGFIHPSERVDEPRLGEVVQARVIGVRPDGILNLSLRQRAHEAIVDDSAMLVALLEKSPTKTLPFTDKSSPEDIKQYFGISKGQFKRAVGNLMKQRRIVQHDEFIELVGE